MSAAVRIERVQAQAYRVPTDSPEADGTAQWCSTTIVLAWVHAGGQVGIGYTYTHRDAAQLIDGPLAECLSGQPADDIPALWVAMNQRLRNIGRPGIGLMAIAALDHALWDLKGKLHGLSVVRLLGRARERVPAYGSGGFTSYSIGHLQRQLAGWVDDGLTRVKMKVGSEPTEDPGRVRAAREAIGSQPALMVDGNGAYGVKQALALAEEFAGQGVCWFEEPVSSDDLEGLALVRERAPAGIDIAAGEYGWDVWYFRHMLDAGAVDVLQVDSTRCGGFTGFMQAASVAQSHGLAVSAHCAPALHAHIGAVVPSLAHVEYFHDHVRIESIFFEGVPALQDGCLVVDADRPGLGLALRQADADRYRITT